MAQNNNNNPLYCGEVPITPMQQWFLQSNPSALHHQQLTRLYRSETALDETLLKTTVQYLAAQHDVLRLQFRQTDNGWTQWCAEGVMDDVVGWEDLSDIPSQARISVLKARASSLQMQLQISRGPIFLVRYLHFGDQVPGYLIMICHRLIADDASMLVLAEDFVAYYQALQANEPIQLTLKHDAFRHWAHALQDWVNADSIEPQLAPWLALAQDGVTQTLAQVPESAAHEGHMISQSFVLSEKHSHILLHELPLRYHAQADVILLSALLSPLSELVEDKNLYCLLECDGRMAGTRFNRDFQHTLGWYAYHYPVSVPFLRGKSLKSMIKGVKEAVVAYPNDGLDYQLYRYMGQDAALIESLNLPTPNLTITFFTQPDDSASGACGFLKAVDLLEKGRQPAYKKAQNLLIAFEKGHAGQLSVKITYNNQRVRQRTIERIRAGLKQALTTVAEHSGNQDSGGYTPSDFNYVALSQAQVDRMTHNIPALTDVFPLSPMQQEMLFYAWLKPAYGAFHTQTVLHCRGHIPIEALNAAWNAVIAEQPILRSCIIQQGYTDVLQGHVARATLSVTHIQGEAADALQAPDAWRAWLQQERQQALEVTEPPLMRVYWIDSGQHQSLVWSYPQWLLDLTSATRVLHAVCLRLRGDIVAEVDADESPVFQEYIKWLGPYKSTLSEVSASSKIQPASKPYTPIAMLKRCTLKQEACTAERLFACWLLLLQRYTQSDTLAVDVWQNDRQLPLYGMTQSLGMYQRIQRTAFASAGQASISAWVDQVAAQLKQAEPEQKMQNPSLAVMFDDHPMQSLLGVLGDINGQTVMIDAIDIHEQPQYDVLLRIHPCDAEGEYDIQLLFNADRYASAWSEAFTQSYQHMLSAIQADPALPCHAIPLFTPTHSEKIEQACCGPQWQTVPALITRINQHQSTQCAVTYATQRINFMQLQHRSNQLAHALLARGIGVGHVVAVLIEPSVDWVIALLGVMKAGAQLLVLSPDCEEQTYHAWLQASQADLALTSQASHQRLSGARIDRLCLDLERDYIERHTEDEVSVELDPIVLLEGVMHTKGAQCLPMSQGYLAAALDYLHQQWPLAAQASCVLTGVVTLRKILYSVIWPLSVGTCVCIEDADGASDTASDYRHWDIDDGPLDGHSSQHWLIIGPPSADFGYPDGAQAADIQRVYTAPGYAAGLCVASIGADSPAPVLGQVLPNVRLHGGQPQSGQVPAGVVSALWATTWDAVEGHTHAQNTGFDVRFDQNFALQWCAPTLPVSDPIPVWGGWRTSQLAAAYVWGQALQAPFLALSANLHDCGAQALDWLHAYRRWCDLQGDGLSLHAFVAHPTVQSLAQACDQNMLAAWPPRLGIHPLDKGKTRTLSGTQLRLWLLDQLIIDDNSGIQHYAKVIVATTMLALIRSRLQALLHDNPSLRECFAQHNTVPAAIGRHATGFVWDEVSSEQALHPWSVCVATAALVQVRVQQQAHNATLCLQIHPLLVDRQSFYWMLSQLLQPASAHNTLNGCEGFVFHAWQQQHYRQAKSAQLLRWDDWTANAPDALEYREGLFQVELQWSQETLSPAAVENVQYWCQQLHIAPVVWFATLYLFTLAKAFRRDSVCIGVEHDLRAHPALTQTLGQLANVGLVQLTLEGHSRLQAVVDAVQYQLFQQLNQTLSYDLQAKMSGITFDPYRPEPFQCLFAYGQYDLSCLQPTEATVVDFRANDFATYWGLSCRVEPTRAGYTLHIGHNTCLFDAAQVKAIRQHYHALLAYRVAPEAAATAGCLDDWFDMITPQAKRQLPEAACVQRLSACQQQLEYLGAQLAVAAHVGYAQELPLVIGKAAWETCLETLQTRLPILTTGFQRVTEFGQSEIYQVITTRSNWTCDVIDLRQRSINQAALEKFVNRFIEHPFADIDAPLIRFLLLTISAQASVVVIAAHPLLLGQHGGRQLLSAVADFYASNSVAGLSHYLSLSLPTWHFDEPKTLAYWQTEMARTCAQPLTFACPHSDEIVRVNRHRHIPLSVWRVVEVYCKSHNIAVEALIQGLLGYLIQLYTNPTDNFVCYRQTLRTANVFGGVDEWWLPVRFSLAAFADATLLDYLQALSDGLKRDNQHRQASLSQFIDPALLTGLVLVYDYVEAEHATSQLFEFKVGAYAEVAVWVHASLNKTGLTLALSYQNDQFVESGLLEQMEFLLKHLERDIPLRQWKPYADSQYQRWVQGALKNRTWLCHESIGQRISRIAPQIKQPIFMALPKQTVTYRDLFKTTSQYIQRLLTDGVQPGESIGLHLSQQLEPVAMMLAIVGVGAVCVPISADWNAYGSAKAFFAQTPLRLCYGSSEHPFQQNSGLSSASDSSIQLPKIDQHALAFTLHALQADYPIQAQVRHNECLMHLEILKQTLRFQANDVWFWQETGTAHEWVMQVLVAVLHGMTLVVEPDTTQQAAACAQHHVSLYYGHRAQLAALATQQPAAPAVRAYLFNAHVDEAAPYAALPAACFALQFSGAIGMPMALYAVQQADDWRNAAAILGRPFADLRIYLLSANQQFSPVGVPGRLWLCGPRIQGDGHDDSFPRLKNPYVTQLNKQDAPLFQWMLDSGWIAQLTPEGPTRLLRFEPQCQILSDAATVAPSSPEVNPEVSPLVEAVADIWHTLLGKAPEATDRFFDLGGDSLRVMQAVGQINERFQVPMRYADFIRQPNFAALCAWLGQQLSTVSALKYSLIKLQTSEKFYRAAIAQEQYWLQAKLNQTFAWDLQAVFAFSKPSDNGIDSERLTQVINAIRRQHAILRCQVHYVQGEVRLVPEPYQEQFVPVVDFLDTPDDALEAALLALCHDYMTLDADFEYEALVRFNLLQTRDDTLLMVITSSTLLLDESSMQLLATDVSRRYAGLSGVSSTVNFFDVAHWQHTLLADDNRTDVALALADQRAYWQTYLHDIPCLPEIIDLQQQQVLTFDFSAEERARLSSLAGQYAVGEAIVLLAVYQLLLAHYFYRTDVLTCVTGLDRYRPDLAHTLGPIDNPIALRSCITQERRFDELVADIAADYALGAAYSQMPFDLVAVDAVPNPASLNRYWQSAFSYRGEQPIDEDASVHLSRLCQTFNQSSYALALSVLCTATSLQCRLLGHLHAGQAHILPTFRDDFRSLLALIEEAPQSPVGDWMSLLCEPLCAAPSVSVAAAPPILAQIAQQIENHPNALALNGEQDGMTYQTLGHQVQHLSAALAQAAVPAGARIGVCIPPLCARYVGVLAVLNLGAVLVPLHADDAVGQVHSVLDQLSVPYVLTSTEYADLFLDYTGTLLLIDTLLAETHADGVFDGVFDGISAGSAEGGYLLLSTESDDGLLAYQYDLRQLDQNVAEQHAQWAQAEVAPHRVLSLCGMDDPLFLPAALATLGRGGEVVICPSLGHSVEKVQQLLLAERVDTVFFSALRYSPLLQQQTLGRLNYACIRLLDQDIGQWQAHPIEAAISCSFQYHTVWGHCVSAFAKHELGACRFGFLGHWVGHYHGSVEQAGGALPSGLIGRVRVQGAGLGVVVSKARVDASFTGWLNQAGALYKASSDALNRRLALSPVDVSPLLMEVVSHARQSSVALQQLSLLAWYQLMMRLQTLTGLAVSFRALRCCTEIDEIARLLQTQFDAELMARVHTEHDSLNNTQLATPEQVQLWIELVEQRVNVDNVVVDMTLTGEFNLGAFERALDQVWRSHPILRARFHRTQAQLAILTDPVQDMACLQTQVVNVETQNSLISTLRTQAFPVTDEQDTAALYTVRLYPTEAGGYWFVLSLHPLIADARSGERVLSALVCEYGDAIGSLSEPVRVKTGLFSDYAALSANTPERAPPEQTQLIQALEAAQRIAWVPQHGRPMAAAYALHSIPLPAHLPDQVARISQRCGASREMVYYAAYQALLTLYAATPNVVVALHRNDFDRDYLHQAIGPMHQVWLDVQPVSPTHSAHQLIEQVRAHYMQQFPRRYARPQSGLEMTRFSGQALRDWVALGFRQLTLAATEQPASLQIEALQIVRHAAPLSPQTDFELQVVTSSREVSIRLLSATGRYTEHTVKTFLQQYCVLLEQLLATPEQAIQHLGHMPPASAPMPWPSQPLSLVQLFMQYAVKRQDAVALYEGECILTYRQLSQRIQQMAAYLQAQGISAGVRVVVMAEHGAEWVTACLALAQLAAVPVWCPPTYPVPRMIQCCLQQGLTHVLTSSNTLLKAAASADLSTLDLRHAMQDNTLAHTHAAVADIGFWVMNIGQPRLPALIPLRDAQILQACDATQTLIQHDSRSIWRVSFQDDPFKIIWLMWQALLSGGTLKFQAVTDKQAKHSVPLYTCDELQACLDDPSAQPIQAVSLLCSPEQVPQVSALMQAAPELKASVVYWLPEQMLLLGQAHTSAHTSAEQIQCLPKLQVCIQHVDGVLLPVGYPGQLSVPSSGPDNAWLDTGIRAVLCEDRLTILARTDDLLNRHDVRFQCACIEQALLQYAGIARVEVLASAESVVTAHVWCDQAGVTLEALRAYLTQQLAAGMQPDEIILASPPQTDDERLSTTQVTALAEAALPDTANITPMMQQAFFDQLRAQYAVHLDTVGLKHAPWQRMLAEITSVVDPPAPIRRAARRYWYSQQPYVFAIRYWQQEFSAYPWLHLPLVSTAPQPQPQHAVQSIDLSALDNRPLPHYRAAILYVLARCSEQTHFSLCFQQQHDEVMVLRYHDCADDTLPSLSDRLCMQVHAAVQASPYLCNQVMIAPLPSVYWGLQEVADSAGITAMPVVDIFWQWDQAAAQLHLHYNAAVFAPEYANALMHLLQVGIETIMQAPDVPLNTTFEACVSDWLVATLADPVEALAPTFIHTLLQAVPSHAMQTVVCWQGEALTLAALQAWLSAQLAPLALPKTQHDSQRALTWNEQVLHDVACCVQHQDQLPMSTPLSWVLDNAFNQAYFAHLLRTHGLPLAAHALQQPPPLRAFSERLQVQADAPSVGAHARVSHAVSWGQQRLLFQERIAQMCLENVISIAEYPSCIETSQAHQAIRQLLDMMPLLTQQFEWQAGRWQTRPVDSDDLPLEFMPVDALEAVQTQIQALVEEEKWRIFRPSHVPLFRVFFWQTPEITYLVWVNHPLIADVWTQQQLIQALFQRLDDPTHFPLERFQTAYAEFVCEQARLETRTLQADAALTQLPLSLSMQTTGAESHQRLLFKVALPTLRPSEVPTYCLLAVAAMLAQWCGQTQVHLLVAQEVRQIYRWRDCLGPLTHARRHSVDFAAGTLRDLFKAMLAQDEQQTIALAPIESVFPSILHSLEGEDASTPNPLSHGFGFSYEQDPALSGSGSGLAWSHPSSSQYWVGLHCRFIASAEGLRCQLISASGFSAKAVKAVARQISAQISALKSALQRNDALLVEQVAAADTACVYGQRVPDKATAGGGVVAFSHRWQRHLEAQQDRCFLSDADADMSFQQLDQRSERLGAHLQAMGTDAQHAVAICLPLAADAIVAMLAAVKIGCPYILLRADDPVERLSRSMQACACAVLVTQQALLDALPEVTVLPVCLDTERAFIDDSPSLDRSALPPNAVIEWVNGSTDSLQSRCLQFEEDAIVQWVQGFPLALNAQSVLYLLCDTHTVHFSSVVWLALLQGASVRLPAEVSPTETALNVFIHQTQLSDERIIAQLSPLSIACLSIFVVDPVGCEQQLAALSLECDVLLLAGSVETHYLGCYHKMAWGQTAAAMAYQLFPQMQMMLDGHELWVTGPGVGQEPGAVTRLHEEREFVQTALQGRFNSQGLRLTGTSEDYIETRIGGWHLGEFQRYACTLPDVNNAYTMRDVHGWQLWLKADANASQATLEAALREFIPAAVWPHTLRLLEPDYEEVALQAEITLVAQEPVETGLSDFEPHFYAVLSVLAGEIGATQMQAPVAQTLSSEQVLVLADWMQASFQLEVLTAVYFQQKTLGHLMRFLQQSIPHEPVIAPPQAGVYAVTLTQQMYLTQALQTPSANDHVLQAIRLKGVIELPKMVKAIEQLVHQHQILKTCFVTAPELQNQVLDNMVLAIEKIDLSQQTGAVALAKAKTYVQNMQARVFDVQHEIPCTLALLRLHAQDYILVMKVHKALMDEVSLQRLLVTLGKLYQTPASSSLATGFAAYAQVEKKQRQSFQGRALQDYWQAIMQRPTYQVMQTPQEMRLCSQVNVIDPQRMQGLAQQYQTHPKIIWLAMWQIVLYAQARQGDFLMWLTQDWRTGQQYDTVIGCLSSDCPMGVTLSLHTTWQALIQALKSTWLTLQHKKQLPYYVLSDNPAEGQDCPAYFAYRQPRAPWQYGDNISVSDVTEPQTRATPYLQLTVWANAAETRYQIDASVGQVTWLNGLLDQVERLFNLLCGRAEQLANASLNELMQNLVARQQSSYWSAQLLLSLSQQSGLQEDASRLREIPWSAVYRPVPVEVTRGYWLSQLETLADESPALRARWQAYDGVGCFYLQGEQAMQVRVVKLTLEGPPPLEASWLQAHICAGLAASEQMLQASLLQGVKEDYLLLYARSYLLDTVSLKQILLGVRQPSKQCVTPMRAVYASDSQRRQVQLPAWQVETIQAFCAHYHCPLLVYFKALLIVSLQRQGPADFRLITLALSRGTTERYALGSFWQQHTHVVKQAASMGQSLAAWCHYLMHDLTHDLMHDPVHDLMHAQDIHATTYVLRYRRYTQPPNQTSTCYYAESNAALGDEDAIFDVIHTADGLYLQSPPAYETVLTEMGLVAQADLAETPYTGAVWPNVGA